MRDLHSQPVLRAELWVDYPQKPEVLRGLKIAVAAGEILGLVGQSGSGKSTLAMAILGLLRQRDARVRGNITLAGQELIGLAERKMRGLRGRALSLIPQSAAMSLNPALRIGTQFREAWIAHAKDWPTTGSKRVRSLICSLGLPEEEAFMRRFPDQISIGQAQRVLIIMALLHNPDLLIADEPTSALDLVSQRDILDLLKRIDDGKKMAILFISHDLVAVASVCDRVAILHAGTIVECGPTEKILLNPQHFYTQKLVSSLPNWHRHL